MSLTTPDGAQPIRAGDPLPPLPSEVLESVDAGRGIRGWILRPEDLDRLPTLTTAAPTEEEEAASATSALLAAYRPDAGGAWPEDRVTVSYAELRRLIALHLSTCAQTMPRERPWHFMALRARAMLDGEVPLLLSEVMDK